MARAGLEGNGMSDALKNTVTVAKKPYGTGDRSPEHMQKMRDALARKKAARMNGTAPKPVPIKAAKPLVVPKTPHTIMRPVVALVTEVTPAMAKQMRDECHYDRQRSLSERNIMRLALEMENGRFVRGTPITLAVFPDGLRYLMNGNHTMEAIMLCGKPQTLTLIQVPVNNEGDAGRMYAVLDIQRIRSWADSLKAMGGEGMMALAPKVMAAMPALMGELVGGVEDLDVMSRQVRIEAMKEYADEANIYAGIIRGARSRVKLALTRRAVMAVALATVKYQPSSAAEFWGGIALEDGLGRHTPQKTLLDWLFEQSGKSGRTQRDDVVSACKLAWNVWFKGETSMRMIRLGGPQPLKGTPFGAEGLKKGKA